MGNKTLSRWWLWSKVLETRQILETWVHEEFKNGISTRGTVKGTKKLQPWGCGQVTNQIKGLESNSSIRLDWKSQTLPTFSQMKFLTTYKVVSTLDHQIQLYMKKQTSMSVNGSWILFSLTSSTVIPEIFWTPSLVAIRFCKYMEEISPPRIHYIKYPCWHTLKE